MRILVVIQLYPPHHVGGYEIACRGVVERLRERGEDVVVLTSDVRLPSSERQSPSEVDVRRTLELWWDWETFGPTSPRLRERVRIERHNQHATKELLAEFRPDVASIWNLAYTSYSVASIIEAAGVPIVLSLFDTWITYGHVFDAWSRGFERRPWARPLGAALGLTTALPTFAGATAGFASRMIADEVAVNGRWKFPDAKTIPLGVDTREFPILEPRDRRWSWRLLYIGRVVRQKGVHTVVKALPLLPPEATLEIDGHGDAQYVAELEALAGALGVAGRVSFSRSARGDVPARYRAADLVVFPSEWREPFGIVPLEAMACGVPVVATGTGGSGEFLEDGVNCVRFQPGSPDDLAAAVRRVAEDPALRRRITSGGAETVRSLNIDRCADELERLLRGASRT